MKDSQYICNNRKKQPQPLFTLPIVLLYNCITIFVYKLCPGPWILEDNFDQQMIISHITFPSNDEFRTL